MFVGQSARSVDLQFIDSCAALLTNSVVSVNSPELKATEVVKMTDTCVCGCKALNECKCDEECKCHADCSSKACRHCKSEAQKECDPSCSCREQTPDHSCPCKQAGECKCSETKKQ
uniref:Metallothionein n=1 Tax=Trichuris muris TaxID=70415 RepID=A0A5S6QSS6_TRIMR